MPCRLPEAGDVVEYPLSEHVQRELMDGRTHGVGLLVCRRMCLQTNAQQNPPLPLPDTRDCRDLVWWHTVALKGLSSLWSGFHCLMLGFGIFSSLCSRDQDCVLALCQVGRNMDRGDAKKLPPSALPMCEVEPLRLEEEGSDRWTAGLCSSWQQPGLAEGAVNS